MESESWLAPGILAFYVLITPPLVKGAWNSRQTKKILISGWTPVLAAMTISSLGGKILNVFIVAYPGMAAYQPVINGVAGNLVAVQASRISTSLHKRFVFVIELEPCKDIIT